MPARFAPGHTLTQEDMREIEDLLGARDDFLKYYQERELQWSAEAEHLKKAVEHYKFQNVP